ncbi:hypothetical protein [Pontixanthobacter aquaemixtae]|uniref:DNA binding HTH domain-containing protein n=1 Tax=Pontixanthobacter aquaemixtae TaxID=1958940 RepID=A0A844ZTM0_9SPHN|nr:hypothetical protein [Pontixanthobacter aquaemixtae]MXO91215.1 hypothetical protein [Pontixanthobacter aquaemixtae]
MAGAPVLRWLAQHEDEPVVNRTKIKPELKTGETGPLNRHWRDLFLDILAETSNVSEAARRAGINPSRAYKLRREEEGFARSWRAALIEGYEHLELDLLARLRSGEAKDGPRHDNAAALRLLALHKDTMAQENAQRLGMDSNRAREIIEGKLEELRQRVIARRQARGDTTQ